jgi:hypothetical protein
MILLSIQAIEASRRADGNRANQVHLGQGKAAGLRHAQAVPKHQEQQAAVPGLVPAALGGGYEFVDLMRGQVFFRAFIWPVSCGRRHKP